MYSNVFDTVRTDIWDQRNVEGMLYTSILNGMHPVFALNQAVDNTALIRLCQRNPEVIDLIADGTIRIAPYRCYYENGKVIDPILGYLRNALTYPEPDSPNTPFTFSSMPFLEECYGPDEIRKIYRRMKQVVDGELRFFQTDIIGECKFPNMDHDHIAQIDQHLETIRKIKAAASGRYLAPRTTPLKNNTLSNRVMRAGEKLQKLHNEVDAGFLAGVNELLYYIKYHRAERALTDNRSNLYRVIKSMDTSDKWTDELKDFVDLCYNEVVAASLLDNEEDIIVTPKTGSDISVYVRNEDIDCLASGQKFEILSNASSYVDTLSWSKLSSVLAEAKSLKIDNNDWKEHMEQILWRHEIKSLRLACQKFSTGFIKFLCTAALSEYGIKGIVEDSTLKTVIKMTLVTAAVTKDFPLKEFGKNVKESGVLLKGAKEYSEMEKYLSQTAYLRRDYAEESEDE